MSVLEKDIKVRIAAFLGIPLTPNVCLGTLGGKRRAGQARLAMHGFTKNIAYPYE
ncbi:MAG: hypothetical protein NTV00_05415 [Methylococcales bacterium]|nr:hypothetical protein [Methylococcales bacterium]